MGRFGIGTSLAIVAYVALPSRPAAEIIVVGVIVAAAVAVLVGITTHEPARRSSWLLVAAAIAVHGIAATARGFEVAGLWAKGHGDVITLLAYPPMLVGLWGVSARRLPPGFGDRRWVIATITVCAVLGMIVIQPTLAAGSLPLRASDRVGLFALLDGVAAAVVGRRLIATRPRNGALVLATAALVLWGDAHAVVGSQVYDGTFTTASVAAASLMIGPVVLGTAALLPDMASTGVSVGDSSRWQRRRLLELAVASVIVVLVTATMTVAATGDVSILLSAGLICWIVIVTARGAVEWTDRPSDVLEGAPTGDAPTAWAPPTATASASPTGAALRTGHRGSSIEASKRGAGTDELPWGWSGRTGARTPPVGELELVHLPYVDLSTGRVVGTEALVRWRHPTLGMLSPTELFAMSGRSTTLRVVDDWIVDAAIRAAASWRTPAHIGINVGAARLADHRWVERVLETAEAFDVDAERIIIETSEISFSDEHGLACANAGRLRSAGFHVAIDDFGSRIGSLRTLTHAPVDVIKFRIGPLGRADAEIDVNLVRAARTTGHLTAVVGIDDPVLLQRAQELDIELGQGFSLSRPLPSDVVARRFEPGPAPATRVAAASILRHGAPGATVTAC